MLFRIRPARRKPVGRARGERKCLPCKEKNKNKNVSFIWAGASGIGTLIALLV